MDIQANARQRKNVGNYCLLEPLDIDLHASKLFDAFKFNNKGESWTYLPFGPFKTCTEFTEWLGNDSLIKMFFTIIDTTHQTPQGIASYHDIDPEHGVIEVEKGKKLRCQTTIHVAVR